MNIVGDARPEIVAPINDGYVYAISPDGTRLWRYDYAKEANRRRSRPRSVVADLNKDGVPELIFGTYSLQPNGGRLVVLENTGALLFDIALPGQGMNGNGIGVPAAPTIADLDGDGTLEILVTTFDHGLDVFTVPGIGHVVRPLADGPRLVSPRGPPVALMCSMTSPVISTSSARNLPRLVITNTSPRCATRSISSRHLALNSPALIESIACHHMVM